MSYAATKLRTLIVEDDDDHAKLLTLELKRITDIDFDSYCCASSQLAIKKLEESSFDLVILDYWLEGETSETVIDWIQKQSMGIPLVIASSANDIYLATNLIRSGAHRYLRKQDLATPMLGQAIRDAIHDSREELERSEVRHEARELLDRLTPREREISGLIASGLLSKQIAVQLGCAEGTVNLHRTHIMSKTGAQSVADLVRIVLESELLNY